MHSETVSMLRRLMVQQENWHILTSSFTKLYECNKILLRQTVYKEIAQSTFYLLKVNYRNTRTRREISSKLTIKTPGVSIVNVQHISHLVLVLLLLTLNMKLQVGRTFPEKTSSPFT